MIVWQAFLTTFLQHLELPHIFFQSFYYCALATTGLAIVDELLQQQKNPFFKKVFVPLFFGFGFVLSFLFFSFPLAPPFFGVGYLGFCFLRFWCNFFLNGSFFSSLFGSRYPLSSLF